MNTDLAWRLYVGETQGLDPGPCGERDVVPNGSFEIGEDGRPRAWHLVEGAPGDATEWLASGGVDGRRGLRISPKGGGACWVCDPIPVAGGAEYLFRCAMKREGNRHWAHACAISWIALVFYDDSQPPCRDDAGSYPPFVIVRCRKTADWVEGGRFLRAPQEARFLRIGFQLRRGEPDMEDAYGFRRFWHGEIDTGQWWIDDVRLDRMPLNVKPAQGRLSIRVPEGGARLSVVNDAGEAFAPAGTATYSGVGPSQRCFHPLRENIELPLPPGTYVVEAMRGFQRTPFRQSITVQAGARVEVEVALPRVIDLRAMGWYEGDHHNHLSFHGETRHPLMSIDDVGRVARGEGLDYLSFCGEIVDQHAYADWREQGNPPHARPDGTLAYEDFISSISHEVTQDLLGHVCLVNAPGHVAPGHPWWITPTNAEIVQSVRKGDAVGTVGAVVMAHPYDSLTSDNLFDVLADPDRTGMNRELPVDVALGLADTMDFLAVEEPADMDLRFRDYARLLNLGFHMGVSGASDAYADQGTELVGALRTVVNADIFTMNGVARAYRLQKTMCTNGPVVLFTVNDKGIGDTVEGPHLRLDARAYSHWDLAKLEIVAGGEIVAEAASGPDGWARIETELALDHSQWLYARAYGPGHAALNLLSVPARDRAARGQWAVTSPIYATVPDKPLRPKREDAEYFIRWINASCKAICARMAVLEGKGPNGPKMSDTHVQTALELFARGRAVYEGFL